MEYVAVVGVNAVLLRWSEGVPCRGVGGWHAWKIF